MNIQLWKSYVDQFQIILIHPDGESFGPLQERLGAQRILAGNTEILIYYGEPKPYTTAQEIYFDFIPKGSYVDDGVWKIRLIPQKIVEGNYHLWMPSAALLNPLTHFFSPTVDTTLTIPSTARNVVAVGAYNARLMTYAPFSRPWLHKRKHTSKAGIVAPGVDIVTTAVGGSYTGCDRNLFCHAVCDRVSGTGEQYGIVQGNDPFLYGEKIRAYLQRGAQRLTALVGYPNEIVGYGALCVARSIL